ncbi:MAG: TatD family deoxyribonuclease [Deltaproteobacteria bacterium]|nr:MAG: TatD family deoxyribonuclease [Deltaproteobacteria bacterium]
MNSTLLPLIDTHAHLCSPEFDHDLGEVLARARAAGVGAVIAVGETLADAERNLDLARKFPTVKPAAGLYPTVLDCDQAEKMHLFIRRHRAELAAIGEVGLDHWVVKEEKDRDVQREIFQGVIRLSKEIDIPLNVHSRSAGRHVVAMLLEEGATRVQLHAFDGKSSAALPAVEAGYFFSIPPSVVRSRQKQKLVKQLPLTCLLVETDSPVLGPEPGVRNEPANLPLAIRAIAEIKSLPEQSVAEAVSENTAHLYGTLLSIS